MMEDGIDSKKGRSQHKTWARIEKRHFDFRHKKIAFYTDIGEKEHRNSRTPAMLQGSKYEKKQFSPWRTQKNAISEQETALCFASVSRMD
jgi:hypothetical protein